jgi:predicted RNA binding protein YcfA (HicA-like mRNA interferase family)
MKVRDIIKAMELDGWRMEKRTATGHRKFSLDEARQSNSVRLIGRGRADWHT